ncbi:MAG: DUF4275 family protein [Lysinibacillus sp.]
MEEFINQLQKHNIKFKEFPHYAPYFRKRWDDAFVNHLSANEKEKINLYSDRYFCGYLWHVFSNKRRPHVLQKEANKAFDSKKKTKCYVFQQHLSDILMIGDGAALKAEFFTQSEDLYIVDEHYTWTYVVTHEFDLGPYFSETADI